MKQGVKWPFLPYDEYKLRIDRAKQLLSQHALDALLLFSPTNWWYYGGWTDVAQMHTDCWRSAMIVCADRDPVVVAHGAFESTLSLTTYIEDVRLWTEMSRRGPNVFWPFFFDTIEALGLSKGVLAIETGADIDTYLSLDEYQSLSKGLPMAKVVSADPLIWEQRMVKTPYEVGIIREGCRRGCTVVRAALEAIRPGVNELEVHKVFWKAAAEHELLTSPNVSTWLCWSSNSGEAGGVMRWITPAVDRIIQEGDQGICDCGPTYRGYQLDFQRTFYVGDPPQKEIDLYKIAKDAFLETIATIKPGIRICDIHRAAIENLQKRDPKLRPLIDFMGHGSGLANHQPPWIRANNETVVQAGMVLCIEIGAFDREGDIVGGMPEDIILVTEDGSENLTPYLPHDLWIAK
jgi:Xaa-Pro aminopeptidase